MCVRKCVTRLVWSNSNYVYNLLAPAKFLCDIGRWSQVPSARWGYWVDGKVMEGFLISIACRNTSTELNGVQRTDSLLLYCLLLNVELMMWREDFDPIAIIPYKAQRAEEPLRLSKHPPVPSGCLKQLVFSC